MWYKSVFKDDAEKHITVVFYFSDKEYQKVLKALKENDAETFFNENIFLIDCT